MIYDIHSILYLLYINICTLIYNVLIFIYCIYYMILYIWFNFKVRTKVVFYYDILIKALDNTLKWEKN